MKTYKDTCPKCGQRNVQLIQGRFPDYNKWTDTLTKFFICDRCLTEYYETYDLKYTGYTEKELDMETLTCRLVKYDADGNKIED